MMSKMEKMIEEQVREKANQGVKKGKLSINVTNDNIDWYLYNENAKKVVISYEYCPEVREYQVIAEMICDHRWGTVTALYFIKYI